jgi:hypothetical protein
MNILYLFYLFVFNNYKNEKLGTDQRYPLVENTLDLDSIIKNNISINLDIIDIINLNETCEKLYIS